MIIRRWERLTSIVFLASSESPSVAGNRAALRAFAHRCRSLARSNWRAVTGAQELAYNQTAAEGLLKVGLFLLDAKKL